MFQREIILEYLDFGVTVLCSEQRKNKNVENNIGYCY